MGATHDIRLPDGTIVSVDAESEAGAAELARLTSAEPQAQVHRRSVHERRASEQAEQTAIVQDLFENTAGADVTMPLLSGALGVADELTLGGIRVPLSDGQLISLEAVRNSAPTAHTAGRFGAALIPALLAPGAGAAAQAARFAPGGLASFAGVRLGQAITQRLGRAGFGRLANRLGASIGGAVDGTIAGVAEAVANSNIEGTPLEGETIAATGLLGAGLGFGVGALLGHVGNDAITTFQRGTRAADDAAELGEHALLQELPDQIEGAVRGSPEYIDEIMRRTEQMPPERRDAMMQLLASTLPTDDHRSALFRVAAAKADAWEDLTFRNMVSDVSARLGEVLTDSAQAMRSLDNNIARRTILREGLAEAVRRSPIDSAEAFVRARGAVESANEAALRYADTFAQVPDASREFMREYSDALQQRVLSQRNHGDMLAGIDSMLTDFDIPADVASRDLAAQLHASLRAAGDHLNPNFSALSDARAALAEARDAASNFVTDRGRGVRVNPTVMEKNLSADAFALREKNFGDFMSYLSANNEVIRHAESLGLVDPGLVDRMADIIDVFPEIKRRGTVVGDLKLLRNVESAGAGIQAAVGRGAVGAALGFLTGGPAGGLAGFLGGTALAAVGHPTGALHFLNATKLNLQKFMNRREAALGAVRSSMLNPRLARATGLGARQIPRVALKLSSPETREAEYNAMVEQVRAYAGNPQMLLENVDRIGGAYAEISPDMAAGASMSMVNAVQHLAANLPPASQPSMFQQAERRPSTGEMIDFQQRFEALEDPLSLLEHLADGTITSAMVEAVSHAYPRLYAQMQADVAALVQELENPSAVPYARRTRIGIFMGLETDPTLDGRYIFAMQQTYSQTEQQYAAQGGRRGTFSTQSEVADHTMSKAASLTFM